ncbi:MAG: DUF3098 domain-containing protein [Cyclobacteriaceae bacterium]|jgi:hypothetical protein|nr:DUF3098 domain-containing protein [Cytophagales bacterium]HNP77943.1 DUF3098 domain-containing protein [Cyclobacteriaceae bacterium]
MSKLPFGKKNYQLMIIGLLVLMTGFTIMTLDSQPHGFGFLGLTLGPVIVVAGFIVEIFAILHRPKDTQ